MARTRNKLTAKQVKNSPIGKHQDGGGLMLSRVADRGKWVFRYSFKGVRREMGLGAWPGMSLADARKERDRWEELLPNKDPIEERKRIDAEEEETSSGYDPTFADACDDVFERHKATLKGDGVRGRWLSPLKLYMIPAMGELKLSEITSENVEDALRPIWRTKHPTAQKAHQRTSFVLSKSQLFGAPCDPRIVDSALARLGAVNHQVKHIISTPWKKMPDLYNRLSIDSNVDRSLRFGILTLVRSEALRGAHALEFTPGLWCVPPERVKSKANGAQTFRVPLSTAAENLVERALERSDTGFLFPSWGRKNFLSDQALTKRLNEMGEAGRVHGFRASFRMWVQDTEACAWEVSEAVLDHKVGGKVERSYARSDLLERRRLAMEAWAKFVMEG